MYKLLVILFIIKKVLMFSWGKEPIHCAKMVLKG